MKHETHYSIQYEYRPNYLYAFVHAEELSSDGTVVFFHEVIRECLRLSCKRLLLVYHTSITLSRAESYFVGSELIRMGIETLSIALVDLKEASPNSLEFLLLVANNRGGHATAFRSVAEAEEWLLTR